MSSFPIDRSHPPRRIVYRDGVRHLELRPWSFDDVDALIAAIAESRVELLEFMPWAHVVPTREAEYQLIARFQADYWAGRDFVFGMFDANGSIVGGVGLHPRVPLNPNGLEVGYWCRTSRTGQGWTTLAVRVLAAVVFDVFACDRFQVSHDEANAASRRVVEKCGFSYEGTVRRLTAEVSEEIRQAGYRGTYRQRTYAIVQDDLQQLPWLGEIRSHLTLFDALGAERSAAAKQSQG
jgi:RimJ/RimL family protein N-acetyltransferase